MLHYVPAMAALSELGHEENVACAKATIT